MKIRPLGAELLHVEELTDGRSERNGEVYSCFWRICEKRLKAGRSEGDKQIAQVTVRLSTALQLLSSRTRQLSRTASQS
jgi:hypothetical protein